MKECGALPIISVVRNVKCLVDTGSTTTILSRAAVERLHGGEEVPQVQVCGCQLITLGGPCIVEGEAVIGLQRWKVDGDTHRVHIVKTMDRRYDGIIGCDLMQRVGVRIKNAGTRWAVCLGRRRYKSQGTAMGQKIRVGAVEQRGEQRGGWFARLRAEYADVFYREGETLGVTGKTVHEIPLKQERVTYVKERRYPQALREHIRKELMSLKRQGIIVDSTSPYNSPLWAVRKKEVEGVTEERYRVVIDYRKLNDNTVDERYPIPRFEDILDRLSGATIFSTLDLKAGYHQIKMHPKDRHKTAFTFERGHYEFTRMPFGLKNAPITFQRLMDEFLRGIDEGICQVYMDDLLVFSRSEEQHVEHLKAVFERLRHFGLKLSEEKSLLGRDSIKFLGHVISREGVRPDPQKVDAIRKMTIPRDVKGIRRLLGALNYYRRFVPDMARYLTPINDLLKKGRNIEITPVMEDNIRKCMRKLQEEPVLAFPDFTKEFAKPRMPANMRLGRCCPRSAGRAKNLWLMRAGG